MDSTLIDNDGPCRITDAELSVLGCFLFGRRWQAALARAIRVHPSLVRRWKSGARPVSARCTLSILDLVASRHNQRRAALEDRFAVMTDTLGEPARTRLRGAPARADAAGGMRRAGLLLAALLVAACAAAGG